MNQAWAGHCHRACIFSVVALLLSVAELVAAQILQFP